MDKKYSIIKVNHRDIDNANTPGGGDTKKPRWILKGEELLNRSDMLKSNLNSLRNNWDNYHLDGIPKPIVLTISDRAKSKSRQEEIAKLIKYRNEIVKIGMVSEYSMLIKIDSIPQLNSLIDKVNEYELNDIFVSAIEDISNYTPKMNVKARETENYKLTFLDFLDGSINKNIEARAANILTKENIDFEKIKYGRESILKINEADFDQLQFVRNLPVKSVEPILETALEDSNFPSVTLDSIYEIEYNAEEVYPIIGLLDSGVEENLYTKNWVKRGEGCQYTDEELNTSHGTYIASLLIYGDALNGYKDFSYSGCKIIDVPIVPARGVNEYELINNIEIAIKSNPEIKVWNLSVSLKGEISEHTFSEFSIELDRIQKENNILIVKSAGNCRLFFDKKAVRKLSIGAENVRGITVGSSTRLSDDYNVFFKDDPTPYSRVGRGPGYIIKPEVVHHGGDIHSSNEEPNSKRDFIVSGESGFSASNKLHRDVGTSYSTPKVAKTIAELASELDHNFNPLILKALTVHSANYGSTSITDTEEKIKALGFGKPMLSEDILKEPINSATLMMNGTLKKGKRIDIMDFPYPDILQKDNQYHGRVKITAVIDPYLEGQLGDEYCQTNLDIKFGTYDEKEDLEENDFLFRFNRVKRIGNENYLTGNQFSKIRQKENEDFRNERLQLKYGDKYYPVKKYEFDISELTDTNLKSLDTNRKWFLFFEGQYRDYITAKAERNSESLSMPYCIIVTISASNDLLDVHTSMLQSLEHYNFEYSEVISDLNIDIQQ